MLAKKKSTGKAALIFLSFCILVAGCTPPGPRALLSGRKLLERGSYSAAVEKLKTATQLMPTNAQAWNYLGLACHRCGLQADATNAYQKAITLDRDLVEARYNRGCFWLEQNRLDSAREDFTACTMRQPNAPEGWIKLGAVQLRARDIAAAERSLQTALRISPQNSEALNNLGLVQLQQRRPQEAAQSFASAIKQQPGFRPALLNLATVSGQYLNDPAEALKRYREYLALKPKPDDYDAVSAVARALEQQLAPRKSPPVSAPTAPTAPAVVQTRPTATASARPTPPPPKAERQPEPVKPPPPPAPAQTSRVEVVKVEPEPVVRTAPQPEARQVTTTTSAPVVVVPRPDATVRTTVEESAPQPEKKGFFRKLNPANWFGDRPQNPPPEKPLTGPNESMESRSATSGSMTTTGAATSVEGSTPAPVFARYKYLSPKKRSSRNRRAAERAYTKGEQAKQDNRPADAIKAYQEAVKLDPGYFEAYYNLGLEAYGIQNHGLALQAWEYALATRSDSVDARYNFALTLKTANYPLDAARELERILKDNPREVRAHLLLGNLYVNPLRQPNMARAHYLKVLELDPQNSQAGVIHYWLVANPE